MSVIAWLFRTLMLLNWLSAPVALLWLAIMGEWWALGAALLSLFSHIALGVALIPGMLLATPAAAAAERNSRAALVLGMLPLLYTAALMTVWCVGVLIVFSRRADPTTIVPLALLAYSIGTAPWGYMATKEVQGGGGEGSMVAVFFAQVGFAASIMYFLLARPTSYTPVWWIMGATMAIEVLFSLWLAKEMMTTSLRDHP